MHILAGLLIVFLNLDEVIRIVRYEDEPKAKLIETFEIDDIQAEAILDTRLRRLAKLEEMELRREHAELGVERDGIQAMLGSDHAQWVWWAPGCGMCARSWGRRPRSAAGAAPSLTRRDRRLGGGRGAGDPRADHRDPLQARLDPGGEGPGSKTPSELKFKEDDALAFLVPAETTDKLLLFASDGRFFTLGGDKLPSARGQGEPLRLLLDLDDRVTIVDVFVHRPGRKRVLASKEGYGFILPEDEALANRKAGKQVLTVGAKGAAFCLEASGDHLAVIGDSGKALIFPLAELPEMPRGKGVKLQELPRGAACATAAVHGG